MDLTTWTWPELLMGWPAIGAAFVLLAGGVLAHRAWLAGLGAVAAVPFCVYLTMSFLPVGAIVLLGNVVAVRKVRRGHHKAAWIWLMPFGGVAGVLGAVALSARA